MRQRLNPIFIVLNNGTYAVEEVHRLLHPRRLLAGCCWLLLDNRGCIQDTTRPSTDAGMLPTQS